MWTRRNAFPLMSLADAAGPPLATSPSVDDCTPPSVNRFGGVCGKEDSIVSLSYTLIPHVTAVEAVVILAWALRIDDPVATVGQHGIEAFKQIEYFFAGTNNGRLFLFPLVPPAMRPFLSGCSTMRSHGGEAGETLRVPWNAGPRRLFHQHRRGDAVTSIATLGRLVASCSTDAQLHVSLFHPEPRHVLTIRHPSPLRAVLLWEGAIFLSRLSDPERRAAVAMAERCVVYVITGDDVGVARLWRSDIETGEYFLTAVFTVVTSVCCAGFATPLHYMAREDTGDSHGGRKPTAEITRQTKTIYSLAVDDDRRLIAGVEGGVVVWCLASVAYKQREEEHLLCWNDELMVMETRATPLLRIRGERLMNMTVWVKSAALIEECLSPFCGDGSSECAVGNADNFRVPPFRVGPRRSVWKPKYGTHVASGFDLGVVCNAVSVQHLADCERGGKTFAESLLRATCATVLFPSLKNAVHFPLWMMEPVFAPMRILSLAGSICTALLVLLPGARVVSGGSDGVITLWLWDSAEETYVKAIVSGDTQSHCGVCCCLSILREPDIFISCGYKDGIVKEWHVYDEPELLMRHQRSFALQPGALGASSHPFTETVQRRSGKGICCAVSFPAFCALFIVGVDENRIDVFGLHEVQGCEVPPGYIFNGYKTVRVLPHTFAPGGVEEDEAV